MGTANRISDLLARIAEAGRALIGEGAAPDLMDRCEGLLSGRGEATGLALGGEILAHLAALDAPARAEAFGGIAARFGVEGERLAAALAAWQAAPSDAAARALHAAAEPRSQELIRRLNRAPGGTRALVALRADLLAAMRGNPALAGLDEDFRHLFASWFNPGFLELRRIDWSTPAVTLEKIIAYEAVHEIRGWEDLRRRVAAPDRRLYGFFHPAMGHEPLIFVEVALTGAIPADIGSILAESREALAPDAARTAVFYSISNCHVGLRGVSFGNFLIKQVVEDLRRDLPGLRTFVTLSPVPGLRRWAEGEGHGEAEAPEEIAALAARYLVEARHPQGGALDPVARFHLGNGARLERINPGADPSPRGMAGSWGLMVNYLYDLGEIERNHEAYANQREVIASAAVRRLLRPRREKSRERSTP